MSVETTQYLIPAQARLKIGLKDETDTSEDNIILPMVETANNMVEAVISQYANGDVIEKGSKEFTYAFQAAQAKFMERWYFSLSNSYRQEKMQTEYENRIDDLIKKLKTLFGTRVRPTTAHRSYRARQVLPSQRYTGVWDN
ncbi:MAG: hypothetical protein K8823_1557 [Cenarchaeum symbiont of Oopsacas minuta]|nr:hypothetical protein [Cenarchaeum symbiont of Oopsacas minuta]